MAVCIIYYAIGFDLFHDGICIGSRVFDRNRIEWLRSCLDVAVRRAARYTCNRHRLQQITRLITAICSFEQFKCEVKGLLCTALESLDYFRDKFNFTRYVFIVKLSDREY